MIHNKKIRDIVIFSIISLLVLGIFLPISQADYLKRINSFDKGPSYTNVVPIEKITFVNYDEESLLDDYAYLASVPTAVFKDQNPDENRLFSHPLLFYKDELELDEDKEKTLDSRVGIDFFMEDWMSYCNKKLDQITLINLPESKLHEDWDAREIISIDNNNPYDIASNLALKEWSYSENAVVAVIDEEFKNKDEIFTNKIEDTLQTCDVYDEPTFDVKQTNSLNPVSSEFEVGDDYVFIKAEAWWDGALIAGNMVPAGDPDLQLFCKKDDEWMQTAAVASWNLYYPAGHEITQSYVYQSGDWRVSITDFPTEDDAPRNGIPGLFEVQGSILGLFKTSVTYHVDVSMYPGINVKLPDNPPYGCRDVDLKLTWDNPNVNLGFTLVGPSGEAICTVINESRNDEQEMNIFQLGECLEDESYSISVFTLSDITHPINFEIEYSWKSEITKKEGDALTSATEGAILASQLNAPLLYTSSTNLAESTKNTLYKLGVENIYLVDIGKNLNLDVKDELMKINNIKSSYFKLKDIYNKIMELSGSNDVVFTTIDPWTYYYKGELKAAGETENASFIGPAAYIAAHHGSPAIIIDNHPELSSATVWHNEFWRRSVADRDTKKPSVAEMYLTGVRIYDFLKEYNFDKAGEETIITVADQYDIGMPWDRMFLGLAYSGRICGSPVDTAVTISRSMFYPVLIFENPALQGEVSLINGSSSSREGLRGLLQKPYFNTLVVKEGGKEKYSYPVLCSFVTHKYRFNERASKYYGSLYQCADGLIPGESTTMQPIDQGVNSKYYDDDGMYFPDMTETEVIPFYLNKGGFDVAFSTELESVKTNLEQGVLLWIHASHGSHPQGGRTLFWDPITGLNRHTPAKIVAGAKYELNPWRGYDWLLGSTEEPDTMTMDMVGIIPFTNHKSLIWPAMGMDWAIARKPIKELLNKIITPNNPDGPFTIDDLYDGLTGTVHFSKYTLVNKNSSQIEDGLGNLHSMGFITSICQTSNTYLHLMMIRHGSVFQVQDPWPTSWYGSIWRQSIPRDIILGYTAGQAYARGISHVGPLYIGGGADGPQWWWDDAENVIFFGDPNLRMYVPSTEYSNDNHWDIEDITSLSYNEELTVNGHMPFGATGYPHEKEPKTFLNENMFVLVILGIIIILLVLLVIIGRKKK